MKSMQREILNYISQSDFLVEEARQAGVSVGFLSNYIEANIDDIIGSQINDAAEVGELYCGVCSKYFNYKNCKYNEAEEAMCPTCNEKLTSTSCTGCSQHLNFGKDYTGKKSPVSREIVCPGCYATLAALKEGQS